ncbi:sigma factor-like helix-turn-helix DNA-binding protein [Nonomuraea sp. NPDC046570]|uniref:RNA polymerase sigma factor n=1 Tax=Nonomuraea sp. NPDC046570 TaxID=3155255 RepID=UPI0033E9F5AF
MPGWPTVDRADDHQLVDALRRAEPDAPERLYDAYAERLHDYACSLTGERDSAGEAVHDALVTAQGCVGRLKESTRLRAWLYALTRFQSVAKASARPTPAQGTPLPMLDDPEDPELAELVHAALSELSRGEREVLELSLRHALTPSEVGAVLGLTSRQATTRLGRARDHLENAAAAVVLARTGRAHCPDLSAMVDSWEGPLTPMLRRRLSGHIGGCEVCTEGRHRHVSAGRLLDMVPVAFPPISLRRRVIETSVNPERDQSRTLIMERGDSFDKTGFPMVVERRSRRRPRRLGPVVIAAVGVLAATGAMVVINGQGEPAALRVVPPPSAAVPSAEPTEPEPELQTDFAESTPEPAQAPTPTPTREQPRPRLRTQPPQPVAATTRPAAEPTTSRRPPAPPTARLSLGCPGPVDGAGTIQISAREAAVHWTGSASPGLSLYPASGSVKAGGSVAVWVTVDQPGLGGTGRVSFRSNGGRSSCAVSWVAQEGEEPEEPEEPTPTPSDSTGTSSGPGDLAE